MTTQATTVPNASTWAPPDPPTVDAEAPPVDDQWAAKLAKLRTRKPSEVPLTIPDDQAEQAAEAAARALGDVRFRVRAELRKSDEHKGLSRAELDDLIDAHEDVVAALQAAKDARQAAVEAGITFWFRALPPDVYDGFQSLHPPTKEQEAQDLVYNPATMIPALMSACSVYPISVEQCDALIHGEISYDAQGEEKRGTPALNQGEVNLIYSACRAVNEQPKIQVGKGSRPTGG